MYTLLAVIHNIRPEMSPKTDHILKNKRGLRDSKESLSISLLDNEGKSPASALEARSVMSDDSLLSDTGMSSLQPENVSCAHYPEEEEFLLFDRGLSASKVAFLGTIMLWSLMFPSISSLPG